MAIVHADAEITPSKQELLAVWLPTRPWWPGGDPGGEVETAGSFRFDDPDGEVGVETILVRAGDAIVQAPLTYRGAPLEGADAHLITTMEHSVLGKRWIYDGCGDPVWAAVTALAVLTGGSEASLEVPTEDGGTKVFPSRTSARGSGSRGTLVVDVGTPMPVDEGDRTVVTTNGFVLTVARIAGADVGEGETLTVGPRDGDPFIAVGVREA
jgi:hypothetical protein